MKVYIVKQSYPDFYSANSSVSKAFKNKVDAEKYKDRLYSLRDKVLENYKKYKYWDYLAGAKDANLSIFAVRYHSAFHTMFDINEMEVIE